MGLAALISKLAKGITLAQVANLAVEHGPELYRLARERFLTPAAPADDSEEQELKERLARLEKLLTEQEEIIRREADKARLFEQRCLELEQRLFRLKIIAGLLAGVGLVLLILLSR